MYDIISIAPENIEKEHICCALGDKKSIYGVNSKKEKMKEMYADGYRFFRLNDRGKAFIDFVPVEHSLAPIIGDGYYYINCFWVSGSHSGKGISKELIRLCFDEIKDAKGVVCVSSDKKRPFLNDKKYFAKLGFEVIDTAPPYFELLCLKFDKDAPNPSFADNAKNQSELCEKGLVVYSSGMCPYSYFYGDLLESLCIQNGIEYNSFFFNTQADALKSPCAFSINSIFLDGKFVTHEILSEKKFEKLIIPLLKAKD
jgi:ribosomal protein S18 acetylase RimI-like enzyme